MKTRHGIPRRFLDAGSSELLVLDDGSIRSGGRVYFRHTSWVWRHGEQWAILGPNGSGKSLLALALCGRIPLGSGEIRCRWRPAHSWESEPERSMALLSWQDQRDMAARESSFYQLRWHSGMSEGERTVAQYLSQASVEEINPFEVGAHRSDSITFRRRRHQYCHWLGLTPLFRRKLACLSNGEQRRVLLAYTLLKSPQLLILDDPFSGLDLDTRCRLKTVIDRLMRTGQLVLLMTSRPDELPSGTTHLLLVENHRVRKHGPRRRMLREPLVRRLIQMGRKRLGKMESDKDPSIPRGREKRLASGRTPLIELRHITVQLGNKCILDDVSWTMRPGEHWALLGPNGSGKTTLLSLIQGDNPQAYALDLRLFGRRPHTTQTLWQARQKIGWVSPELHLHHPAGWSCLEVVCSGFFNSIGLHRHPSWRQRATARRLLRELGLAGRADEPFGDLTLGAQRLALLARAVVKYPRLLILDEPCQGLDAAHRRVLLTAVDRVVARSGAGLVFVTHHVREWPRCMTHVLELRCGRTLRQGRLSPD